MNTHHFSRRNFLRGVGVTMALPWMESVTVWGDTVDARSAGAAAEFDLGGMDLAALADSAAAVDDLLDTRDDSPVIRLINALLLEAVKEGASDVHVETQEKRIDQGVKSGELTKREAARLEKREAKIQSDVAKAKALLKEAGVKTPLTIDFMVNNTSDTKALAEVLQACTEKPCSAADILPVLFKRQLDLHQTTFAMGESIAHLHALWLAGRLHRQRDPQGIYRFSPA